MSRNVFFILLPLCPYVSTTCPHKIKPLILLYPLFMLTPLQDRTKPSLQIGTYFKTFLCDVYFWNYSHFTLMPMCELNRSMLERGTYEDSFCHGGGKKIKDVWHSSCVCRRCSSQWSVWEASEGSCPLSLQGLLPLAGFRPCMYCGRFESVGGKSLSIVRTQTCPTSRQTNLQIFLSFILHTNYSFLRG